jgi:hypothetical protein
MNKVPRIGRPPKPAKLRRTRRLQLLLTNAEWRALDKYAIERQMTASEVMRGCLRSLLVGTAVTKGGAR